MTAQDNQLDEAPSEEEIEENPTLDVGTYNELQDFTTINQVFRDGVITVDQFAESQENDEAIKLCPQIWTFHHRARKIKFWLLLANFLSYQKISHCGDIEMHYYP